MSFLVTGIMILAIMGGLATFVGMERKAGGDKVRAELQPKLTACQASVEQQNTAITATKADGDRRVAEATKGVARATKETVAARTEAERLKGLQGGVTPSGACPAGSAAAELRKGIL